MTDVNRDIELLHPILKRRVNTGLTLAQKDFPGLEVFEGWRAVARQQALYNQGRTTPGAIVTQALPWHSWHQYGLAVDFAVKTGSTWSWQFDGKNLAKIMMIAGLAVGPSFEQGHFELTGGLSIDEAKYIAIAEGTLGLWYKLTNLV